MQIYCVHVCTLMYLTVPSLDHDCKIYKDGAITVEWVYTGYRRTTNSHVAVMFCIHNTEGKEQMKITILKTLSEPSTFRQIIEQLSREGFVENRKDGKLPLAVQ